MHAQEITAAKILEKSSTMQSFVTTRTHALTRAATQQLDVSSLMLEQRTVTTTTNALLMDAQLTKRLVSTLQ
jgi:hypothetical protein